MLLYVTDKEECLLQIAKKQIRRVMNKFRICQEMAF